MVFAPCVGGMALQYGVAFVHLNVAVQAIYGRSTPTLLDYVGIDTSVEPIHSLLSDRTQALTTLKENLIRD